LTSLLAIVLSALLAGTLDITATGSLMRAQGTPFRRLLQFVASAALGPSAFEGGVGTAIAGLTLHFVVAGIWALIYFTIADRWPLLIALPVLSGALFGAAVHVLMSLIVVPLSRAAKRPFSWKAWLTQLAIHIVCVGIPIAWLQTYWLSR
jgi:uncharacterized membrane protein YagU involved in acid resistance